MIDVVVNSLEEGDKRPLLAPNTTYTIAVHSIGTVRKANDHTKSQSKTFDQQFKCRADIRIKRTALWRRYDPSALLDKQGHAQGFLDLLHLVAYCRVGQAQLVRSLADALMTGSRFKALQRLERRQFSKVEFRHLTCRPACHACVTR